MSRKLDDLTPRMRDKAIVVIARMAEAGIPVMIVDTLRTLAEQQEHLRRGVSWTLKSKHLPGPDGKSRAIDLAPYAQFQLHGPNKLKWTDGPEWLLLSTLGKAVGLISGRDWTQRDLGHLELPD